MGGRELPEFRTSFANGFSLDAHQQSSVSCFSNLARKQIQLNQIKRFRDKSDDSGLVILKDKKVANQEADGQMSKK